VEDIYAINGWNSGISGMDIFTMYNIQQNGSVPYPAVAICLAK